MRGVPAEGVGGNGEAIVAVGETSPSLSKFVIQGIFVYNGKTMKKPLSISKRMKSILAHITDGLSERDEAIKLALLSTVAGENILLYGPHGTAKNLVAQRVKCAFKNGSKIKSINSLVYTASNESEMKEAWEQSVIRLPVTPVRDEKNFLDLVAGKISGEAIKQAENAITSEELSEWKEKIEKIRISREAQKALVSIRNKLSALGEKFYISDERWIKIGQILKTAAFLNGRKEIDLLDCTLISRCVWNFIPEEAEQNQENSSPKTTLEKVTEIIKESIEENSDPFAESIPETEEKIKEYDNFIDENFFETSDGEKVKSPALFGLKIKATPCEFEMADGTKAYKILDPQEIRSYDYITPHYISEKFSSYEEGKGAYFLERKERVARNDSYRDKYFLENLKISDGKATWNDGDPSHRTEYTFKIQMIPEKFIEGDEGKLKVLEDEADEKYAEAAESVQKLGTKIRKYLGSKKRHYKSNLFATGSMDYEKLLSGVQEEFEYLKKLDDSIDPPEIRLL